MPPANRIKLIAAVPFGLLVGVCAASLLQLVALGYGMMALVLCAGLGLILLLDTVLSRLGLKAIDLAGERWGKKPPASAKPTAEPGARGSMPLERLIFGAAVLAGVLAVLLGLPVDKALALLAG